MGVVNLGQLGEPRQSPIGGMGDAMYKGSVMGRMLANTKQSGEKLKLERKTVDQKDTALKLVEKEQEYKGAKQTYDLLSERYATEKKVNVDNFLLTDPGKEVLKKLKSTIPEAFDAQGNFVPASNYDVVNKKAQASVSQAMLDLENGNPTDEQLMLLLINSKDKAVLPGLILDKLAESKGEKPEGKGKKSPSWYSELVSNAITNIAETGNWMGIQFSPERKAQILELLKGIGKKFAEFGSRTGQPSNVGNALANSDNKVTNFKVEE